MIPTNWQIPSTDAFIYQEVVAENQYQLPDDMKGMRVLDVGAHVGCFAKACLDRGASMVHSYEPCNNTFEQLVHNIRLFPEYKGRIVLHKAAMVGIPQQTALLYHWERPCGYSLHRQQFNGSYETVPCVHINAAFEAIEKCDLVKLDCEDAEYQIIFNSKLPSRYLTIEFHGNEGVMNAAIKELERYGFTTTRLITPVGDTSNFYRIYNGEKQERIVADTEAMRFKRRGK